METFGSWLLRELGKRGMSQADLAREAGLTTATVSRVINQERAPSAGTCAKVAQGLDMRPEDVYKRAGIAVSKDQNAVMGVLSELLEAARTLSDEEIEELTYIALGKKKKNRRRGPS